MLYNFIVLLSYLWCQTSSISSQAPDPDPGWFSESRTYVECLAQIMNIKIGLLKYIHSIEFKNLFVIEPRVQVFCNPGSRFFWGAKTGSTPLIKWKRIHNLS